MPLLRACLVFFLAFALRPAPAAAQCDEEQPFRCALHDAAERGRDHIRRLEAGTGFADGVSHRDNALAVLVFVERWRLFGPGAMEELEPRDRALVRRLLTRLLEREAV